MAEKRGMKIEDLLNLKWAGDPQISPDGKKIIYVGTIIDPETKAYESKLWQVPTCGKGKPAPFTNGKNDSFPRWSPCGESVAFVSNRSGEPQIWVLKNGGGEAQQLTTMRYGANNPVWSPDGSKIAFIARMDIKDTDDVMCTPVPKKDKEVLANQYKDKARVIERMRYKMNGMGYLDNDKYAHIWVIDACGGTPKRVTEGNFNNGGIAWSPDGSKIAFTSNRAEDPDMDGWKNDVYVTSVTGGEPIAITHSEGSFMGPVFGPCGTHLIFGGSDRKYAGATHAKIYHAPADGSKPAENILPEGFDVPIGDTGASDCRMGNSGNGFVFAKGKMGIYFQAHYHGATHIYYMDVKTQQITQVTEGNRQIFAYDFSEDRNMVALGWGDTPNITEISVLNLETKEEIQLTHMNQHITDEVEIVVPEEFWYKAEDGWDIQGWLVKPLGWKEGHKYPLIVEIHGGPHTMYGYGFFHEFQVLASQGYAVLYVNPRGSHGYSQEFVHACIGNYGRKDYTDIMTGVDVALAKWDWIDADRLAVTGGSYGGFMTNWIVGQTNRFKAAATQRSITNWMSFFGCSDIGYSFTENELNVSPFGGVEALWDFSPLKYVENIKTPLLIIHSEQDYRCPIEQGEQIFIQLKKLGQKVRFCRFDGANHDLSRNGKPSLRMDRLNHIVTWFNEHIDVTPVAK